MEGPRHVFVRGPPRSGKTTLVQRLVSCLKVPYDGFITTEVRHHGRRIGFDVVSVADPTHRQPLARVGQQPPRVGKYSVEVRGFEGFLAECVVGEATVTVVDEVGKMELCSALFRSLITSWLEAGSILGTLPSSPLPFVQSKVLSRTDVELYEVQAHARDESFQLLRTSLARRGWLRGG